jgi:protein-disulfide isomerase
MKYIWILLIIAATGRAENLSNQDIETIQRLRMQAEQERMEKEFAQPKEPVIEKDRAVIGTKSAPITIVAYSDFQCPYCKNGFNTIETVRKKYGSKIRFMFKHFPLSMHPMAMPAAKRFEAIALQSSQKAYRFHDAVFKNQDGLTTGGEKFLDGLAKKIGANVEKMKKDLDSDTVKKHIDSDMAEAQKFGISGTPGFIVAGIGLYGAYPPEAFYAVIDRRLKGQKQGE